MQINIAGRYRLVRALAPGVWLADGPDGAQAAVKLAPQPVFPPVGLRHPRIVALLEAGSHQGEPYFVMEYMDSSTLRALLEAGPLPPAQAVAWMTQLLEGLDYAHGQRVVHRDIKPSNLLIDSRGGLKLADFGLASGPGAASSHGTPGYMAPEQMRGRADQRSDLYAAAVVLYEMLAGRRPHQGTPFQLMQQALTEPPPPLPAACAAFQPVLDIGLSKSPASRFQHASEFLSALYGK